MYAKYKKLYVYINEMNFDIRLCTHVGGYLHWHSTVYKQ